MMMQLIILLHQTAVPLQRNPEVNQLGCSGSIASIKRTSINTPSHSQLKVNIGYANVEDQIDCTSLAKCWVSLAGALLSLPRWRRAHLSKCHNTDAAFLHRASS